MPMKHNQTIFSILTKKNTSNLLATHNLYGSDASLQHGLRPWGLQMEGRPILDPTKKPTHRGWDFAARPFHRIFFEDARRKKKSAPMAGNGHIWCGEKLRRRKSLEFELLERFLGWSKHLVTSDFSANVQEEMWFFWLDRFIRLIDSQKKIHHHLQELATDVPMVDSRPGKKINQPMGHTWQKWALSENCCGIAFCESSFWVKVWRFRMVVTLDVTLQRSWFKGGPNEPVSGE